MRKEYLDELAELKLKMEKAELFAEKLPFLSETILRGKITGEEEWLKLADKYKKIYLKWGLNRGYFRSGSRRYVMNYPKDKEYNLPLFSVYINTITLFDTHQEFGLYDYLKGVDIFFSDVLNSTFYVTDDNIEAFLEALNTWYCDAAAKLKTYRLEQQEAELKKKLADTQKQIEQEASA